MRLAKTAHTSRPWRVHELAEDFELEDVWRLPTPGGPDDLARLVQQFTNPQWQVQARVARASGRER